MTIILEHICKSYQGVTVLDDFNAQIEDDRCYAFIGPEGCGKSTILKIFMGNLKPDSGKVSRMGDYKYPTLQSAFVSSEDDLRPRKNAIWHVTKADRTIKKENAMEELSLFFTVDEMKLPSRELTTAQKQLVKIVRAMFLHADFIVLDEPFLGMNESQRLMARDYILKKRGRRPLLIASRTEDDLEFARKIQIS